MGCYLGEDAKLAAALTQSLFSRPRERRPPRGRRRRAMAVEALLLEEDRDRKRGELLTTLEEGQTVPGVVKNITEYGVFIDLGGLDGLLHIIVFIIFLFF